MTQSIPICLSIQILCKIIFQTVYHLEQESDLVELILMFSRAGFPLTTCKICSLAYQFVQNNNIKGFSKHANSAGKKWMCHFLYRHKEIRIKKAHNLSVNHAMCANPAVFNQSFKQYEAEMKCQNIQSPQQIWNCDESGCQDVPKEYIVIL